MSWFRQHAVWIWPASLMAGLVLIAVVRVWSGWASNPVTSLGAEGTGVVAGDADDLASTARRIRVLKELVGRMREQFTAVQARTSTCRQQVAALDEMLASDRLTDCPAFLREQTTVRALQKIIREATGSEDPSARDQDRLNTAAVVARERLRTKLQVLRDQLTEEATRLETQAATLRQQLTVQTAELETLQREARRQLQSRSAAGLTPAA